MHMGISIFCFSKFDRHHELQVLIEPVKQYETRFTSFLAPSVSCSYSEEVLLQKIFASALLAIVHAPRNWDTQLSHLLVAGE